jgi:hypothetical protein
VLRLLAGGHGRLPRGAAIADVTVRYVAAAERRPGAAQRLGAEPDEIARWRRAGDALHTSHHGEEITVEPGAPVTRPVPSGGGTRHPAGRPCAPPAGELALLAAEVLPVASPEVDDVVGAMVVEDAGRRPGGLVAGG